MNQTLLRSWWLLALRGLIAIVFGVLAIAWPAITLLSLAVLFAAFALLGGAVWIFGGIQHRKADQRWWLLLLFGLTSMLAGAISALYPGLTTLALVLVVGANALVTGILDIVVAIRVRKFIRGELLLVLSGIASVVFGVFVLLFPAGAGALALALLIGTYALITGVMLLVLAIRVRSWTRLNQARSSPSAGAV
ncbi:MAG: DUF308 domain-containing protein [Pseudomonadota bacterium]